MVEFALEELMAGEDSRRRGLIRQLCLKYPSQPALSAVFALTTAASMIEDNLTHDRDASSVAALTYKLSAILAGDIFAVESLGQQPARCRDLLHFWRRVDGYFLEL